MTERNISVHIESSKPNKTQIFMPERNVHYWYVLCAYVGIQLVLIIVWPSSQKRDGIRQAFTEHILCRASYNNNYYYYMIVLLLPMYMPVFSLVTA